MDVSFRDFDRHFPRMSYGIAPDFHDELQRLLGYADKTSKKIETCGLAGRRIDCKDDDTPDRNHIRYVPVTCNRRVCPECAYRDMLDRTKQFSPIAETALEFSKHPDWRVRFWTLTVKAAPKGADLRPYFDGLKSALFDMWRELFTTDKRKNRKKISCAEIRKGIDTPALKASGGVFFLETQGGWNPHLHGLVFSPFMNVDRVRESWKRHSAKYGLRGERIHIELPYVRRGGKEERCKTKEDFEGAISEIVSYPIKPEKNGGRHDQVLLAHVEAALQGRRRYIVKGAWYNKFERPEHHALCCECLGGFTHNEMLDGVVPVTKQNFFTEDEPGLENWKHFGYRFPAADLRRMQECERDYMKDFPTERSLKNGNPSV